MIHSTGKKSHDCASLGHPAYGYGGQQAVIVTQAYPMEHREIKPPNYMILSMITYLFFCWIFGLIELSTGQQVHNCYTNLTPILSMYLHKGITFSYLRTRIIFIITSNNNDN